MERTYPDAMGINRLIENSDFAEELGMQARKIAERANGAPSLPLRHSASLPNQK